MYRTQKVFERETVTVSEDGEMLSSDTVSVDVLVKTDEQFAFIFTKLLQYALQLEGTEIKVLLWCIMNASLNDNEISLNRTQKERIQAETRVWKGKRLLREGLSLSSVENSVSSLKKKQLLLPVGRAVYQVSPMIAWRGKITKRDTQLKLLINLRKEGAIE